MKLDRRHALLAMGSAILCSPTWARPRPRRLAGGGPRDPDAAAFLEAVDRGDLPRVEGMLAAAPSLAAVRDDAGRSALVRAHLAGRTGVAAVLRRARLELGLELDIVEAVLAEDWARMEALAAEDPGLVDALHPIGGTPIHAAAIAGSLDLWRLRSLGCDPNGAPAGGTGWTPARTALACPHDAGARVALTDLLANGADPNVPQRDGDSLLHAAVRRRDEVLVRVCLRKGVDVETRDARGRRALGLARELGWRAGVRLLEEHESVPRDHRASRFARTASGDPVQWPDLSDVSRELQSRVTSKSHFDLAAVKELVGRDARLVFSISTDDELAIEASAHIGSRDVIRFHLDHGAPLSLPTAVSLGDTAAARAWLEEDPLLVHERGAHDFPVMWYAVLGGGSVAMAELLFEHGVGVDQESLGATALHWCVLRDDRELAAWLLEHGADRSALAYKWSLDGHTPLQLAREKGRNALASLLQG